MICMIIVRVRIYIPWFMKKADDKVTICYSSSVFGGVQCGCECHMLIWLSTRSKKSPECAESPFEASSRFIRIHAQWPCLECGQHPPGSVTNGVRYAARSLGSDCKTRLVRVQSCPKTPQATSWWAEPWPVPINPGVGLGVGRPVISNHQFRLLGFSISGPTQISYCQ